MSLGSMIKAAREKKGISIDELASRINIAPLFLEVIENPGIEKEEAVEVISKALEITPEQFRGEEPLQAAGEKKKEESLSKAKYPAVRKFILDPSICRDGEKALGLFENQPFPLAEKNIVLYLSTSALYKFCDTNTSSFGFDEYLFNLHGKLLVETQNEISRLNISDNEKEERIDNARSNIFACESIENIAIMILEPFARELENKLLEGENDFRDDLGLPFLWDIDDAVMKIEIFDEEENVIEEIKLLDVKERVKRTQ